MNYLAHLVLGRADEGLMVGSLLVDFVRGEVDGRFPGRVAEGIRMHRAVDAFVDAHGAMEACRRLVSPDRRRFAGIITDICFDHFLSLSWSEFVPEVGRPEFIRRAYDTLDDAGDTVPPLLRLRSQHHD